MQLTLFEAVVLGIVQGLTEFLPVSSSGHLILVPWLLGWSDHGLVFDVALHLGTSLALLGYFWRDWFHVGRAVVNGLRSASDRRSPEWRLAWMLVYGSAPAAGIGLAFEKTLEENVRQPALIATTLIVFALVLLAADRWGHKSRKIGGVSWTDAAIIGCAQAVALVPGVSRSGITITAALFRSLDREAAARFSFLLSAPIIVGGGLYKLQDIVRTPPSTDELLPFAVGVLVAATVGAAAIGGLLRYLARSSLAAFVWYRIGLGAVVLGLVAAGR